MRLNKGVSDAKDVSDDGSINYVYICTELNKAATGCNMKPSGPLLNNNPIYVDDNQTNALKVTDFDRTYARLHFSDPQCFLGLDATGKPVQMPISNVTISKASMSLRDRPPVAGRTNLIILPVLTVPAVFGSIIHKAKTIY